MEDVTHPGVSGYPACNRPDGAVAGTEAEVGLVRRGSGAGGLARPEMALAGVRAKSLAHCKSLFFTSLTQKFRR